MYKIAAETIIKGDLSSVWAVVIDVDNWPTWDPHEQEARLDGSFAVGTTGWSKPNGGPGTSWKITKVVEQKMWASESPMPGGKIAGENVFEPLGDERIRCSKTVWVSGPLVPLFWFYFGRMIRRDMFATWAALERESDRRKVQLVKEKMIINL
ncbi:SRPBCC family protein [Paenibacillus sp. GP183]|jgi:hypothetical protein|uniref:SRPBCC family protein n=1 Tax=Paenibacillus sp. GP183 TaxID=1882751 RepID=UPI00089A0859|nr:SRPBCC family protein [Paenibacillus sp. GP183]SEC41689.1 Polyketide cyclase / dehydrase and lipid transport [Paenibacillus sp. GP183]